jgi:hypothetical protein
MRLLRRKRLIFDQLELEFEGVVHLNQLDLDFVFDVSGRSLP